MFKKVLCAMLSLTACFCFVACGKKAGVLNDKSAKDQTQSVLQADNKCGDNAYWDINGSTLRITGKGDMYDFTVNLGKTELVTWEGTAPWFEKRAEITDVIVSEGITSVGNEAFRGFVRMNSIALPDTLLSVGDSAFKGCVQVEAIIIPDSVKHLGSEIFKNSGLKSLVLGSGIEECGEDICKDCNFLQKITLNEGIKTVGDRAFAGCNLITEIIIPNSVTSIGKEAFECGGVERLTIGTGLTEIPALAFGGNIQQLDIPEGITSIGRAAFSSCNKLKSVNIPSTVKKIEKYAFASDNMDVYYNGTEQQWKEIDIDWKNKDFFRSRIHYK